MNSLVATLNPSLLPSWPSLGRRRDPMGHRSVERVPEACAATATAAVMVSTAGGKAAPTSVCSTLAAEEAVWLPAARRGEPQALARFYEAYQPMVWGLCRRLLRSEADAEDALQTTFVRAFSALPRFRGEGSVKTWLYRIALNEAMTQLRRRASGPDMVALDEERDGSGGGAGGYSGGRGTEGASAATLTASSGDKMAEFVAVRALLDEIKPEYRTVLVLRFWEDLAYEEIAEITGLSLSNVKMRLHRAKEEFRRLYHESDEPAAGGKGGRRS